MTEAEWLAGADYHDLDAMLDKLRESPALSHRKMRLFAHACWRRVWDRIGDIARRIEEISESYADGKASFAELDAAYQSARSGSGSPDDESFNTGVMYDLEAIVECAADDGKGGFLEERFDTEHQMQCRLLRDVFGNPFRSVHINPSWLPPSLVALAEAIYTDRAFDRLPILADALEDAGCTDAAILEHCRGPGPHVRGCWVVDLILGKS
jgi:hypothetical protein